MILASQDHGVLPVILEVLVKMACLECKEKKVILDHLDEVVLLDLLEHPDHKENLVQSVHLVHAFVKILKLLWLIKRVKILPLDHIHHLLPHPLHRLTVMKTLQQSVGILKAVMMLLFQVKKNQEVDIIIKFLSFFVFNLSNNCNNN